MTATDDQAPATKQDIALLIEMIGKFVLDMQELRQEMREMKKELRAEMQDMKEELQQEMQDRHDQLLLLLEQYRRDIFDVYHDKLAQHDDRLVRLEVKVGFRRAA